MSIRSGIINSAPIKGPLRVSGSVMDPVESYLSLVVSLQDTVVLICHTMLTYIHHHYHDHHRSLEPAEGRRATHSVLSAAVFQIWSAEMPVSCSSWLIQVWRGLPGDLRHDASGCVPWRRCTARWSALCAGVSGLISRRRLLVSQKYEKYGTLPKVAAPYSTVKHVSFLDELLCRIWSFEVKRCGYWERWVKRYEQVGQ